ncbi:MAG: DUF1080 domain-containing protein, partial [Planctomycetia bacterium]|nr:DUF1080 domain-containing protein [Planctomycetia bacterium]
FPGVGGKRRYRREPYTKSGRKIPVEPRAKTLTYPKPGGKVIHYLCLWGQEDPDREAERVALNPDPSGWNHYEIVVLGKRIVVRLNGVKTFDGDIWDNSDDVGRTSILLTRNVEGRMRFRDIRIKDLSKEHSEAEALRD